MLSEGYDYSELLDFDLSGIDEDGLEAIDELIREQNKQYVTSYDIYNILSIIKDFNFHVSGNIELEAKFGNFYERKGKSPGFYSEVSFPHFKRLLTFLLNKYSKNYRIEESSVRSLEKDFNKRVAKELLQFSNIRKITTTVKGKQDQTVIYQKKTRIQDYDFEKFNIKISLNREENIDNKKIQKKFDEIYNDKSNTDFNRLRRDRSRHSFIIENLMKIELTKVLTNKNKETNLKYEVELEYIGKNMTFESFSRFEKMLETIFKELRGTDLLFLDYQKKQILNDLNKSLGKSYLVQARNIKQKDLVYGGIVGNPNTSYWLTFKADGLRKLLVIHETGIWIAYPGADEFNLVEKDNKQIYNKFGFSVFDGEFLETKDKKRLYLAFDCIIKNGDVKIQDKPYSVRRENVDKIAKSIKFVKTKPTVELKTPKAFFENVNKFLDDRNKLNYEQDGLMFFPESVPYNPHSDDQPLSKRVLTNIPDTVKWKEPRDITIDFAIRRIENNRIELQSYDLKTKKLVPFKGSGRYPFENDENSIVWDHEITNGLASGSIVEYEWDNDIKKFLPRKYREEKKGSNSLQIAIDNWNDIMNPITSDDIRGRSLKMAIKYHNVIKENLYEQLNGANILDIGSGRGGDIDKWIRYGVKKVVAVEPNNDNLSVFRERLEKSKMKNNVRIVNTGGENSELITENVSEFIGKVDAVTLMLSMSFFWKNENFLDSLIKTIVLNLKPGGKILFLTIDGSSVEELFKRNKNVSDIDIGPAKFHLYPKKKEQFSQKMDFSLSGSIVGDKQTEYLVNLSNLTEKLNKYGFQLADIQKADKERLLSDINILYSSLYSYGYYENINKDLLEIKKSPIKMSSKRKSKLTKQQCEMFRNVPNMHPVTKQEIKINSDIYKELVKECGIDPIENQRIIEKPPSPSSKKVEEKVAPPKRRGRPKKQEEQIPEISEKPVSEVPKRRGRPKKIEEISEKPEEKVPPKRRGRPKQQEEQIPEVPKKDEEISEAPVKRGRGRPRKSTTDQSKPIIKKRQVISTTSNQKRRGRPRKDQNVPEKKVIIKNPDKPLSMLSVLNEENDDKYAPVNCTWYENVVRIATLGGGSCLIHSLLKAFDKKYQENKNVEYRENRAAEVRRDLSMLLDIDDPKNPPYKYWETISNGFYPLHVIHQLKNEELIKHEKVDFSLNGIERLLNSTEYLGNETYSFLTDVFNLDIYIFEGKNIDLIPNANTRNPEITRNAIVIMGNREHYEVIGIMKKNGIQTVFPSTDPFYKKLVELFPAGNETKINLEDEFIHEFVNSFKDENNKFIFPAERLEEVFNEDDPFYVTSFRLKKKMETYSKTIKGPNPNITLLNKIIRKLKKEKYDITRIEELRSIIENMEEDKSFEDIIKQALKLKLINNKDRSKISKIIG